MPNIDGTLSNLEGLKYSQSLDGNMGYYHIQLSEDTCDLYIIILPW